MKYYLFKLCEFIFKLMKWYFMAIILVTLSAIVATYLKHVGQFPIVKYISLVHAKISSFTHYYVDVHWDSMDMTNYIIIGVAFILMMIAGKYEYMFSYRANFYRLTQDNKKLDILRESNVGSENAEKLASLDEKIQQMQSASRKNRETLMNEFITIKKQLDNIGRNLAFLSVDVVDSTGMKKSEDPIVIARDFLEYRKFAEAKLNAHGCIKSAWTPDGIMACFNTIDETFKSAQAIIHGLEEFNRSVKAMKQDFAVRCGINAGYLLFDESLPLEQISDRVIDIAGHMQKQAEPNTIFLAKNIVQPMETSLKFTSTSQVIDELDVYQWRPNSEK